MATNLVKKWQTLHFRHSGIQKRNGILDNALYMHDLIAPLTPLSCKILVKIGPVVSAENRLTDGNCVVA